MAFMMTTPKIRKVIYLCLIEEAKDTIIKVRWTLWFQNEDESSLNMVANGGEVLRIHEDPRIKASWWHLHSREQQKTS